MKLHIEKKEASVGLIFKKKIYEMYVSAEMTAEERAAYEKVKDEIGHMIIAEYSYKGIEIDFKISSLVHTFDSKKEGFRFEFSGAHQMPPMENEIKEGVAGFSRMLKDVIAGKSTGKEVTEF